MEIRDRRWEMEGGEMREDGGYLGGLCFMIR